MALGFSNAWSDDKGKAMNFSDFLNLDQKLSQAVCDEGIISKAPAMDGLGQPSQKNEGGQKLVELRVRITEAEFISALLGDKRALIAAPAVMRALAVKDANTNAVRRKASLDICTAQVKPGGLKLLLSQKPSLLIEGVAPHEGVARPFVPEANVVVHAVDIDRRYGMIGEKTLVPGWIEIQEVLLAKAGTGGRREYQRIAHPITNNTLFIIINDEFGFPLGFLHPSSDPIISDWETLKAKAESEVSRQKQLEVFQFLIEESSLLALEKNKERGAEIRENFDFYKKLMASYKNSLQDPPALNEQFQQYRKRSGKVTTEAQLKRLIDDSFFRSLKEANVNGSKVHFEMFLPNAVLQGMFYEHQDRLEKLTSEG